MGKPNYPHTRSSNGFQKTKAKFGNIKKASENIIYLTTDQKVSGLNPDGVTKPCTQCRAFPFGRERNLFRRAEQMGKSIREANEGFG